MASASTKAGNRVLPLSATAKRTTTRGRRTNGTSGPRSTAECETT